VLIGGERHAEASTVANDGVELIDARLRASVAVGGSAGVVVVLR
jgi:hypothetical protein